MAQAENSPTNLAAGEQSSFALIGPGRLGMHLSRRLTDRGWRCVAIRSRRPVQREQRRHLPATVRWDTWEVPAAWPLPAVVVLCVPDREIESVATQLASGARDLQHTVVLHCSGLATAASLRACAEQGAATASWHPLQSFPPLATGEVRWSGTWCAVEGEPRAVATGFAMARLLGMIPWQIDARLKPRYHAAAAVAGNLTHVLVAAAKRVLESCGLPAGAAGPMLSPLALKSVESALGATGLEALTGPMARADQATIEHHLAVLPKPVAEVYLAVTKLVAEIESERL